MNRYLSIIVKITLIVILAMGGAFVLTNSYYFSFVMIIIAIALLAISIINDERKLIRKMKSMMDSVQHGDMSVSFPADLPGLTGDLNRSMNKALSAFQARVYNSVVSDAEMEAWQKLIRVLAHEMMNSLAPIISLSETMTERGQQGTPNEREYALMLEAMQSIHRRSKGLLHFVENYRKLTRIPDPIRQFFSVRDLFTDIERLVGNDAANIKFSVQPASIRLYADRSQIEQVILNLLKNAIEAYGDGDGLSVWVEATKDDAHTVIRISDNGPGILQESLDKIFVPFYTTKQTGSGIGLSLSRQIINRHGGKITVESPSGGGTVFTLVM